MQNISIYFGKTIENRRVSQFTVYSLLTKLFEDPLFKDNVITKLGEYTDQITDYLSGQQFVKDKLTILLDQLKAYIDAQVLEMNNDTLLKRIEKVLDFQQIKKKKRDKLIKSINKYALSYVETGELSNKI